MFTTMCPTEQHASDSLIVKDKCFVTEIFDKFSFSGTLRGCLSHLTLFRLGGGGGGAQVFPLLC